MTENTPDCTCTTSRLGPCHVTPTTVTNAGIAAIVAKQSRPNTHNYGESVDADHARQLADRHREQRAGHHWRS